jgi:Tol biopolymer transport system component
MNSYPEREQENSPSDQETPKRRRGFVWAVVIVAAIALILCVAAGVVLGLPYLISGQILRSTGEEILLAFPSRRGDVELYMLKLGQDEDKGTFLAEDAEKVLATFWLVEEEKYQGRIGGDYGGFVLGSDRLLLWYGLEDEIVIQQMHVRDEESAKVLESQTSALGGIVFNDPELVFLEEPGEKGKRCYVARPGGKAERVAKGDDCEISLSGSAIYFSETDGDEITISTVDVNGENEVVLVDGLEGVDSYRVSEDGSHIAYVRVEEDESRLYLVEQSSGEEVEVSDMVFRIVDYGFAPGSDTLFYVTEEVEEDADHGVLRLYVSDSDAPIAEGPALSASFTPDGQHLVYLLGNEDDEETLYVHPMDGGEDVEVVDGEEISYSILETSPLRVLALSTGESEFTLYSVSVDGGDVIELLNEEDVTFEAEYVPNGSLLYVQITNEDGEVSLFVAPMGEAEGYTLLEEWASIEVLNRSPDGRQLALWAQEDQDDDPVLYSIVVEYGADPVELDDDSEGFRNAVFTSDGRFVLYTAVIGDESDDVEVRRVRADGEEDYEILYEGAHLVDVRWDDIVPSYVSLYWQTVKEAQYAALSRIAFVSDRDGNSEIYVMNADGSEVLRLTDKRGQDGWPVWSPDGQRIAFISGGYDEDRDLYVVNADGSGLTNLTGGRGDNWGPAWSPDGQRILFVSNRDGDDEIYVMDADGSGLTNLTNSRNDDWGSSWSPDGQRILFVSHRSGDDEIYVMDADGDNVTRLTHSEMQEFAPRWSPDGRYIAFSADTYGGFDEIDIYVMDASCIDRPEECESSLVQLTEGEKWNLFVDWSPDGKKILFASNRIDNWEVYVMDVDGQNLTRLTDSRGESSWPSGWSANGKLIVFESDRDGDSEIYVMDADGGNVVQLTDNRADDGSPDLWP